MLKRLAITHKFSSICNSQTTKNFTKTYIVPGRMKAIMELFLRIAKI